MTRFAALSGQTFEVELSAPPGVGIDYRAGQYATLTLDVDGKQYQLSYSIANRFDPEVPARLQLFVQNQSPFSGRVLARLAGMAHSDADLDVTVPMGRAFLQTDLRKPHLLVAAGSGISKIKCITEEILQRHAGARVDIYWSNRQPDEFYLIDRFTAWASSHARLNFTPILESADPRWPGRTGFIYRVIEQDIPDLSDTQAYLCGSPQMVYGTVDKLRECGLKKRHCYSDVFEYAPRDEVLGS